MFYVTMHSTQLKARVVLYASSQRQDNTYHGPLVHQSWSTGWTEKLDNRRLQFCLQDYQRQGLNTHIPICLNPSQQIHFP